MCIFLFIVIWDFFFLLSSSDKGKLPVASRTIMPGRTEYLKTNMTQQKQSFHAQLRGDFFLFLFFLLNADFYFIFLIF